MSRVALPRRSLFAIAAAAWLAVRGGGSGLPAGEAALRALCSDLHCPRRLGQGCLKALPEHEPRSRFLTAALFSDLPPAARRATSARALAAMVRESSREDFRAGRIDTVDGWMLSRTETRLFALATLLEPERSKGG
ncbi:MAG: hypothetical protein ACREFP_00210 [Acetobacteraceae bacterium]